MAKKNTFYHNDVYYNLEHDSPTLTSHTKYGSPHSHCKIFREYWSHYKVKNRVFRGDSIKYKKQYQHIICYISLYHTLVRKWCWEIFPSQIILEKSPTSIF